MVTSLPAFAWVNLDRLRFLKKKKKRSRLCHTQIWSRFSLRLRLAFSTCGWERISGVGAVEPYPPSRSPPLWGSPGNVAVPSWMGQYLCGKARMLSKHSTGKTSYEFGSDLVRIGKCGMSDQGGVLGEFRGLGTFVAFCSRPQAGPRLWTRQC